MHFYKYLIFYCYGDGFNWSMCWWMRLNWETNQKNPENRNSQKDSFSWVSSYTGGSDKDKGRWSGTRRRWELWGKQ